MNLLFNINMYIYIKGYAMPLSTQKLLLGGSNVDLFLQELMNDRDIKLSLNECRKLKEENCYVAFDFAEERLNSINNQSNIKYLLPDGKVSFIL